MAPLHLAALNPFPVDRTPKELTGGVVAIGNFDGLHRGHQVLLDKVKVRAGAHGAPALVLTFEPHPRTVLRPETPVFRLTPLPAKARLLKALAIDGLAVAAFDRAFAAMPPDEFIDRVLVRQLQISGVVVGFNFRFGRARAGDAAGLAAAGARLGFDVQVVEPVAALGAPISSSDIRSALSEGDVGRANALLGYRWFVTGVVERGEARGRELGFPTANIRIPQSALKHGIYAVRVQRPGAGSHDAVASYGIRPTFGGGEPLLEVHIFDFAGSLYGEEIAVSFVEWIRPEAKFAAIGELVAAMTRDLQAARAMLGKAGPGTPLDLRLAALP